VEEPDRALVEAAAAGVGHVIAMGVDLDTSRQAARWAAEKPGVFAAAGHHPLNQDPPDLGALRELLAQPRVVAVGEVGLDHVDEHRGQNDAKHEWFGALCDLALELGLPVGVHVRGTERQVHDALSARPGLRGVMHYWTLGWEWAERFLDLGFLISFSGVVTRASRDELREVARRIPEDRLLLETDAPWGTPQGRTGAMRPAWLMDTARRVAEVRGLPLERLEEIELANVRSLFPKTLL